MMKYIKFLIILLIQVYIFGYHPGLLIIFYFISIENSKPLALKVFHGYIHIICQKLVSPTSTYNLLANLFPFGFFPPAVFCILMQKFIFELFPHQLVSVKK